VTWRVVLCPAAEREYARLSRDAKTGVLAVLRRLGADPRGRGVSPVRGAAGVWRVRAADHRVLFRVEEVSHEVRVLRIARRDTVYRRLRDLPFG
jgi:mRNA-degrading endonuclease RelE of RelBE toxin-antitoxin system